MASKKKRELSPAEIDAQIVGNRSVREWERHFKPVEQGFYGDLSFTSHRVGVLIVRYNGAIVYVGSGTAKGQGMLARLRQIAFNNSTGGHHSAAQTIRDNLRDVELELLLFRRGEETVKNIVKFAKMIKKKYNPQWAASESIIQEKIANSYSHVKY